MIIILYIFTFSKMSEQIINKNKESLHIEESAHEFKNIAKETKTEHQEDNVPKEISYGETSYRWFFLISFCLSTFSNQMQWVTFSAILNDFSINYEIATWKVDMFSLLYMIICIVTCIPEAWLLDSYSIRITLILAAACNIIGSGLKLLINKDSSLACCYVGQSIAGLFQSALLNSPGKIAANWFREDIRTVICTVCCLSVTIGALVGYLWNLMFIKKNSSQEDFKDQTFYYLLSEFIVNFVFYVPSFFITKDKPDIPPSPSQEENINKPPGLIESLRILFSKVKFIYLLVIYTLTVAYFDIMSTIINLLLELYTISGDQSSVIYAVSSVVGMVASLIFSKILDKTKKFKLIMIILTIMGVIFQSLYTLLLELIESKKLNAYAIGLVVYSLINISIVSVFTIGMNYACEITYPVGESISNSIMASLPQALSIGLTFLCDYFINDHSDKKWISNIILLVMLVISVIFVFLLDEKLDRQEIEHGGKLGNKNEHKGNNEHIVIEMKHKKENI